MNVFNIYIHILMIYRWVIYYILFFYFRMFPRTFEYFLGAIGPSLTTTTSLSGRKPIPAKKQMLITLWFMATPDSYRLYISHDHVN